MSPDERHLLESLFERIRTGANAPRDAEAEALIENAVRALPHAPYLLAQAVIVQDQALQGAMAKIRELEDRNSALEAQGSAPSGAGTSFLGGLFGTTSPQPAAAPAARGPMPVGRDQPQSGPSPWEQPAAAGPWGSAAAPAGGGFLRGALGTAAGVAGGMMLANSLGGLFGGNHGFFASGQGADQPPEVIKEDVVNNYYGVDEPKTEAADQPDESATVTDADFDDSGTDFSNDSFDV